MSYDALEKSRYSAAPAECYRFTQGVNQYLYTSADRAIALPGGTYNPEVISRNAMDQSQESNAGNLEVSIPRDNTVARLFVAYLPVTPVSLTIYRTNIGDSEVKTIFVGTVGACQFEGPQAKLICRPISASFKKQLPVTVFQSQCNLALYSPACSADKNAFKVAGPISVVSGADLQIPALSAKPDGWFNNGWVERINGDVRFILNHVGSTITLMTPFTSITASESVSVFAGCNRSESVCAGKFSNLVNYIGFSRMPVKNPYDQNGVF